MCGSEGTVCECERVSGQCVEVRECERLRRAVCESVCTTFQCE